MTNLTAEELFFEENCRPWMPEFSRILIVGVIGAAIAPISVIFNIFLFFVLYRNPRHRNSHLIYLMFLAIADTFLSAAYVLLFPVSIYMDWFEIELLAMAWFSYLRIMITISHIFITTSAFLICAAAFERYIMISKISCQFARNHRLIIIVSCLIIATVTKAPIYIENQIIRNLNCTGVTYWTVTSNTYGYGYDTIYKFWVRNVVTIILPFIICFYLNFAIMNRLRIQHVGAKLFRFATSEHRQNIRAATLMLVAVTCTYLLSNLPNFITNTIEFIDKEYLSSEEHRPFYTIVTDMISLLTVLASACRLPIYFVCNARIRCEILDYFDNCILIYFNVKPYATESTKQRCRATTVRYCDTGNGYMIYDTKTEDPIPQPVPPNKKGERRVRSVGTGLDRVVLSVAMGAVQSHPKGNHLSVPLNQTSLLIEE